MIVPGWFLLHEIATGLAGATGSKDDQGHQSVLGGNLANSQHGLSVILIRLALSVHHSSPGATTRCIVLISMLACCRSLRPLPLCCSQGDERGATGVVMW